MLQITPQMKILVAVDFRKGIDGLVQLCKQSLQQDPFAGAVFVFRNRRGTALKALVYDGQGFWLCHKRLSNGRFGWWPSGDGGAVNGAKSLSFNVSVHQREHVTRARATRPWTSAGQTIG